MKISQGHGAAPGTYPLHLAISMGPTERLEPGTDEECEQAARFL